MNRRNILIITLILLIGASYSCKKEVSNTTIVHGQILDSLTNEPIESVIVSLQGEDLFVYPVVLRDTLSDSEGRFQFKFEWTESHDAYSIRTWKTGYKYANSIFLDKGIDQNITIKLVRDN